MEKEKRTRRLYASKIALMRRIRRALINQGIVKPTYYEIYYGTKGIYKWAEVFR